MNRHGGGRNQQPLWSRKWRVENATALNYAGWQPHSPRAGSHRCDKNVLTGRVSSNSCLAGPKHDGDFPDYGPGDELNKRPGNIISKADQARSEIDRSVCDFASGISGGPIVNDRYQVVGIAQRGGTPRS